MENNWPYWYHDIKEEFAERDREQLESHLMTRYRQVTLSLRLSLAQHAPPLFWLICRKSYKRTKFLLTFVIFIKTQILPVKYPDPRNKVVKLFSGVEWVYRQQAPQVFGWQQQYCQHHQSLLDRGLTVSLQVVKCLQIIYQICVLTNILLQYRILIFFFQIWSKKARPWISWALLCWFALGIFANCSILWT